jgi:hypothetical protein
VHLRSFWYGKEHPFWKWEFLLWSQSFEFSIKICESRFIWSFYLANRRALKFVRRQDCFWFPQYFILKVQKSTINFVIYVSVSDCFSLCAWYTWAHTETHFMNFLRLFFKICRENSSFIKIWQEWTHFTRRPVFIYDTLISSHIFSWNWNSFRPICKLDLYTYFVFNIVYLKMVTLR